MPVPTLVPATVLVFLLVVILVMVLLVMAMQGAGGDAFFQFLDTELLHSAPPIASQCFAPVHTLALRKKLIRWVV